MKLSDITLKRLVVINSTLLVFAIIVMVGLIILLRPQVKSVAQLAQNTIIQNANQSIFLDLQRQIFPEDNKNIPVYHLSIKSDKLREIEVTTQKAAREGVLRKPDKIWIPAQFTHNEKRYEVKIRVRGDLANHWEKRAKSWRVKFKKDKLFKGKREINLILNNDKAIETELVAYQVARKLGLLVPDAGFVRLYLNQIDMGLYFWMEQPGKEMLESLKYPAGEIINPDNVWVDTRYNAFGIGAGFDAFPGYYSTNIQKGINGGRISKRWQELLELVREADLNILAQKIPFYINIEKFAKWSALSWVFGSGHAQQADNVKWYYDTTTGRFEPILYDVNVYDLGKWDGYRRVDQNHRIVGPKEAFDPGIWIHKIVTRTLQIPQVQLERNKALWNILNNSDYNIAEMMRNEYQHIRSHLNQGMQPTNISSEDAAQKTRSLIIENNRRLLIDWIKFSRSFSDIRFSKNDVKTVIMMNIVPDGLAGLHLSGVAFEASHAFTSSFDTPEIFLENPNGEKKTVHNIRTSKNQNQLNIEFDSQYISVDRSNELMPKISPWKLYIVIKNKKKNLVKQNKLHIVGYTPKLTNAISNEAVSDYQNRRFVAEYNALDEVSELSQFMDVEEFIHNSNVEFKIKGDKLVLEAGTHIFTKTMSIPKDYGLQIKAGAKLRLGAGVSIVVHNSIEIQGTAMHPVTISAIDPGERPWGTFSVIMAKDLSNVSYLKVSGGSDAWVDGIYLSGQLNFYHSDVNFNNLEVRNAFADDGLNVKSATTNIVNSVFENNSSDGFDGDWVKANIMNSVFINNKGDGADFSGSNVLIADTKLLLMGDKGISAGENSKVTVYDSIVEGNTIGVASKDLSNVDIYASLIIENQQAISLYQKKSIFGPAYTEVIGSVVVSNDNDFTVEKSSQLTLIGTLVEAKPEKDEINATDLNILTNDQIELIKRRKKYMSIPVDIRKQFDNGPKTEPIVINGFQIPDLSTHSLWPTLQ